ncbi:MAG: Glycosyl transferase, group 1, partial [uncultured Solirubrobacteraceae bacterium]
APPSRGQRSPGARAGRPPRAGERRRGPRRSPRAALAGAGHAPRARRGPRLRASQPRGARGRARLLSSRRGLLVAPGRGVAESGRLRPSARHPGARLRRRRVAPRGAGTRSVGAVPARAAAARRSGAVGVQLRVAARPHPAGRSRPCAQRHPRARRRSRDLHAPAGTRVERLAALCGPSHACQGRRPRGARPRPAAGRDAGARRQRRSVLRDRARAPGRPTRGRRSPRHTRSDGAGGAGPLLPGRRCRVVPGAVGGAVRPGAPGGDGLRDTGGCSGERGSVRVSPPWRQRADRGGRGSRRTGRRGHPPRRRPGHAGTAARGRTVDGGAVRRPLQRRASRGDAARRGRPWCRLPCTGEV